MGFRDVWGYLIMGRVDHQFSISHYLVGILVIPAAALLQERGATVVRQCGEDSGRQGSSALFTDQLMGWLESVSVVTETKYRHVYGHDGTHAG
ncbi:hypothetical protein M9435_003696 [Picochlorum sp. BPE23]|nr:hypothetical protein M9435_003696 [Picochlorum sp. BPE23]